MNSTRSKLPSRFRLNIDFSIILREGNLSENTYCKIEKFTRISIIEVHNIF